MVRGVCTGQGLMVLGVVLCLLVLWDSPSRADLFEVRNEEGKRRTSTGDTVAYELFVPVAKPNLPPPPWPAVILTHGLGRNHHYHSKNARYLASRGIVLMAADMTGLTLGRPAQGRNIANTVDHLLWLMKRSLTGHDKLENLIDSSRMGLAGHSAGGAVSFEAALLAQQRSIPITALCLLDAVPWDRTLGRASSLKSLHFASLRSEPGVCNFQGKVVDLLRRLRFHAEDIKIVGSNHCDAENPSNGTCWILCGGKNGNGQRLYQRLMYLFFQDVLGVISVEKTPEIYESALAKHMAQGEIARRPVDQALEPFVPMGPDLGINQN